MYEEIARNRRVTWLIIVLFVVFIVALGYVFGQLTYFGNAGVAIAFVLALALSFGSYYYSDQLVLSISGARPVEKQEYPYLYNTVEGLAIAAGLRCPSSTSSTTPHPTRSPRGATPSTRPSR